MPRIFLHPIILALVITLTSCATVVNNATNSMAISVSSGIMNAEDVKVVKEGLPAYVIMLDGYIIQSPNNTDLLDTAASLNSLYASQFVESSMRSQQLLNKALGYSKNSICLQFTLCDVQKLPFADFKQQLSIINENNLRSFYVLASTWASWIKINSGDWNAVADIARVEAILEKITDVDGSYEYGMPHVYLGVLAAIIPPALGGKPEVAKHHFETARSISNNNLIASVMYAKHYARMVFDKTLHDALLNEVVNSNRKQPNLTLSNTLAQNMANQLLQSGEDYF